MDANAPLTRTANPDGSISFRRTAPRCGCGQPAAFHVSIDRLDGGSTELLACVECRDELTSRPHWTTRTMICDPLAR